MIFIYVLNHFFFFISSLGWSLKPPPVLFSFCILLSSAIFACSAAWASCACLSASLDLYYVSSLFFWRASSFYFYNLSLLASLSLRDLSLLSFAFKALSLSSLSYARASASSSLCLSDLTIDTSTGLSFISIFPIRTCKKYFPSIYG